MFPVTVNVTEEPVPTGVPLQDPEYHSQSAPVPSVPPLTVKVTEFPVQTEEADSVILIGSVDKDSTVTVTCSQSVLLQVPSDLTK